MMAKHRRGSGTASRAAIAVATAIAGGAVATGAIVLGGPFTAKLSGYVRRRYLTQEGLATPWVELQERLAPEYDGKLTVGTGFDYTGDPQFPPTYFNGLVHYNLSSSSSLSLFAGQRRGGLLCVSGVCRVYAPFEGARLDATVRF